MLHQRSLGSTGQAEKRRFRAKESSATKCH
jgi:hypothetical protein